MRQILSLCPGFLVETFRADRSFLLGAVFSPFSLIFSSDVLPPIYLQVLRGSTPNMTCIYESDVVPVTTPPIKLRMLHQSAGVLNEVDLQSNTTIRVTATLESEMTSSDFEISCEIFSDLSTRVRNWPETVTTQVTVYDITTSEYEITYRMKIYADI
mgnify:FL=1